MSEDWSWLKYLGAIPHEWSAITPSWLFVGFSHLQFFYVVTFETKDPTL